jgi:hypothetical protein
VAQSQAVAKAVCYCLKSGVGVAEAVSLAASSGNANTAAQAIAEAAAGGECRNLCWGSRDALQAGLLVASTARLQSMQDP